MGTAILLVYSTFGIASGKIVCRDLKMADSLIISKYQAQFQFDFSYEMIVPSQK